MKELKETLEEAAERYDKKYIEYVYDAFIEGAKWQQERSYSEQEILNIVYKIYEEFNIYISKETALIKLKKK